MWMHFGRPQALPPGPRITHLPAPLLAALHMLTFSLAGNWRPSRSWPSGAQSQAHIPPNAAMETAHFPMVSVANSS